MLSQRLGTFESSKYARSPLLAPAPLAALWGSEIMKCGEAEEQRPTSFADSDYNSNLGESKLPRSRANFKMFRRAASCDRSTLNLQGAFG